MDRLSPVVISMDLVYYGGDDLRRQNVFIPFKFLIIL